MFSMGLLIKQALVRGAHQSASSDATQQTQPCDVACAGSDSAGGGGAPEGERMSLRSWTVGSWGEEPVSAYSPPSPGRHGTQDAEPAPGGASSVLADISHKVGQRAESTRAGPADLPGALSWLVEIIYTLTFSLCLSLYICTYIHMIQEFKYKT